MADEKLNTGPEEQKTPEAAQPAQVDPVTVPEQAAAPVPQPEQAGPAEPVPGDVVVSFEQINELMAEKRQAARAEIEKAEDTPAQEAEVPAEGEEPKKPRRGRPPKAEKAEHTGQEEKAPKKAEPRRGRPSKADKAAPGDSPPSSETKCPEVTEKPPRARFPRIAEKIRPRRRP